MFAAKVVINYNNYMNVNYIQGLSLLVLSSVTSSPLSSLSLQKGPGYHVDMFIVGLMIFFHSVMGLPWVVGSTILSVSHVQSLHRYGSSDNPGEAPNFLGVRCVHCTLTACPSHFAYTDSKSIIINFHEFHEPTCTHSLALQ